MTHGADDYALVIGINHYPKWANGKKTLKGAISDAQKFHRWLINPEGGGLDPANARLVLSTEDPLTPLQHVVDCEFEIIRDNSKRKTRRRFYFFFSGHGHSPAMAQGEQALCLANWSLELPGAALHFKSYLNAAVGCLNFEESLFFLDCCRVQEATPLGKSSDLECGNPKLGGKQYMTFYATEHYEAGYEVQGDEPHGYFGRALLDILEKGTIEAFDLEKRLGKDVKEFAQADSKKQVARALRYVDREIFLGPPLGPAPPGPDDEPAPSEAVLSVKLHTNFLNILPLEEPPPPSPGSITLYRGEQFVASMRGAFKMPVPIGDYTIHITHGEAVEVHAVNLQTDTELRYELPRRNSAAPLSSTLDKREIITDPIVAASSRLTNSGKPLFPQAVFIAHRKKSMPIDGNFNGQLTLEGSGSFERRIVDSRMLIGTEPGTYTLRYRELDAGSLCLAVPVVAGWDTQIFFVEDEGRPVLERASVFMRPAGKGFDPADALIDAYEQALADLVSGGPGPDQLTQNNLLYGKFKNPLFGLVGAHFLLRELRLARQIFDDRLHMLHTVIGNMGRLFGENNADVIALKLLRAKLLKQAPDTTHYDGAPLLRASLLALIDATADQPASAGANLDAVALGAFAYSPWCCWQEVEAKIVLWSLQAQGNLHPEMTDHISLARLARAPEWVVGEMKAEIERSERTGDPVNLAKVVRRLTLPRGILEQALRVAQQEVTKTKKSTKIPVKKRYLRAGNLVFSQSRSDISAGTRMFRQRYSEMNESGNQPGLLTLTTEIVAAFVGNNAVATSDLPTLIASVFQSLSAVGQTEPEKAVEAPTPAAPIKKSVQQDFIVCLEDGKKLKILTRHLATRYNMTPEDYRRRWGLAKDYPMVAPAYAAQRSSLAKQIGLGRKPAAPAAAAPAATKTAPSRRVGGRRKATV